MSYITTSSPPSSPASAGAWHGLQRTPTTDNVFCNSRQALKKYVQANNNLGATTDAQFTVQFNKALQRGSDSGVFARPKGTSVPTITFDEHNLHG